MVLATWWGWSDLPSIALAVALAFLFGYALTIWPVLRSGLPLRAAVKIALAADTLSILTMEIVDNAILLAIPGAMESGLTSPLFWGSLAVALAVAFVVTVPVNRALIARGKGHAAVHATACRPPLTARPAAAGLLDFAGYANPVARRDRRRPDRTLARAPGGAEPRPDPGPDRAARRPAAGLPGDPPDRDQRQGQHRGDDRVAAARRRAAHRPVHLAARDERDRADHHRRRADQRRAFRRHLARDRALRRARRRAAGSTGCE